MKEENSKAWNVFSNLKSIKLKIIVIAILTVIMIVDMNPFVLKAGRETLVYTFEDGVYKPFAFDNNHNTYSYYGISKMGGHIAYCLDYSVKNAPNGTGLQYVGNVKSNKIVSVLTNGYPNKSAAQLGVSNDHEAYLATQMAVWMAANGTSDTKGYYFDINKLQPNVKYSESMEQLFNNSKKAANKILQSDYPSGSFALDMTKVKVDYDYSDTKIKIGPYRPVSKGVLSVDKVKVYISNPPVGTQIVDKNGTQKDTFGKNEEIYVLINKNEPGATLYINASGTANKNVGIIYGTGSFQNFVFLDTEQEDIKASAAVTWKESRGNIKVVKNDQDKLPVQGAEFALINSEGKQISSGKTDANGVLQFNKLELGSYTITETSVPDGYIIEKASYPVTVKRDETSVVNIQNTKVKGVLQIEKLEKNSKVPIQGVVFEIYDKDGKVVEKLTTDANGIATSKELLKGEYTYKEVSAPDGYIMDTNVYDFNIDEKVNAVRKKITNEKIVGKLEIIKTSDDGKTPLKGAEFEIYDSKEKLVKKVVTDEKGMALVNDLEKGDYTFKEVKAPDGYDKDTKEYTFKIETLNQTVKQSVVNKKIYGKLKIEKVDENNNKVANVKFEILDKDSKVIKTVVTDEKGIATIDNLPVGKYKYREIDTPELYVLDEKEYDFEITSKDREVSVKVVNERAKGIIKIIKIDKDTKAFISNVKFNVIDKSTNKIVDTIITDENGIARTKALPTGEYMYQEVEVPEDYILDTKTYSTKIKKNNDTAESKVQNEHKKLPITGGFLSTDILIVIIITAFSVIAYVLFKILRNINDGKNSQHNFTSSSDATNLDTNDDILDLNSKKDLEDKK